MKSHILFFSRNQYEPMAEWLWLVVDSLVTWVRFAAGAESFCSAMAILRGTQCTIWLSPEHYMAFAKTPKRIRIAVLSSCFKIGLKYQVKKSQKFPISCPTTLFCLSCKLPGIKWVYGITSNHLDQ